MIYWQCNYYVFLSTVVFFSFLLFTLVRKLFNLIEENERLKEQLYQLQQGEIKKD